jgi:hypothetical protein
MFMTLLIPSTFYEVDYTCLKYVIFNFKYSFFNLTVFTNLI